MASAARPLPVDDVGDVADGERTGTGTTFVCVPGRLDGEDPADGAPRGEIVAWEPRRAVGTRLQLTPETWTTRIELADTDDGGTRVTMTVTHEPVGGSRVATWLQRGSLRRMVQRTVDAELDKVPDHVALLPEAG